MSPTGFTVRLQVLTAGHVQATAALARRWSLPAQPTVQTVRRNGFASTLFTPNRARPTAPAVIFISGSSGGEDTTAAAALAMVGYPALALGYFKEPGLPQCLCGIPLEYFARAVRWLRAQPVAWGRPVILFGASRGAEGALLVASYEPHLIDAVVASSPSNLINGAYGGKPGPAWTFHGKPLRTGTPIPVRRIRVPLLLSDGGQDAIWNSAGSATAIVKNSKTPTTRRPTSTSTIPAPVTRSWASCRISPTRGTAPTGPLAAPSRPTPWLPSNPGPR